MLMTMTKVNLVNQMKKMKSLFLKLLFLTAVIYFKNFNTKHIFTKFHLASVQENVITAFYW